MRISWKLLIFLGAPHAASVLMPRRIAYLKSCFNTSWITPLFPLIMASAMGLFIILVFGVHSAADDHSVVRYTLLAIFVALAIVEHLTLILQIMDSALRRWALERQGREELVAR
jgi:putative photosynthetic complex assembly protein 2